MTTHASPEVPVERDTHEPAPFDHIQNMNATLGARLRQQLQPLIERGLERHAIEIATFGYTVIPPDKVTTPQTLARITDTLLRLIEERTGVHHALDQNGDHGRYDGAIQLPNQYHLFYLPFADRVFEDWLDNTTLAAMVDYVMRGQAQLHSMVAFVKWKGDSYGPTLGLHADSPSSPEGLLPATHPLLFNSTLILTDYTREAGSIAMVPGSHLLCRQPTGGEGVADAVPVEATRGSLILWHGNTWHGAFPKSTDGLRLNLNATFSNPMLKTQERYGRSVPDEMLARHGERFARIMGANDTMGWTEKGPDPTVATYVAKTMDAARPS